MKRGSASAPAAIGILVMAAYKIHLSHHDRGRRLIRGTHIQNVSCQSRLAGCAAVQQLVS